MAGFAGTKTQRFIDVKPGSQIQVEDYANAYEPFTAFVLEVQAEFGPQRIPMLMVKADHSPDPILLMADGKTRVQVIVDSNVLAAKTRSANVKHLRAIPVEVYGLQFRGGVESATEIIQFAAGKAQISWHDAVAGIPEMLMIGGTIPRSVQLGDWVIEDAETGTILAERGETFDNKYEDFE